MEGECWHFHIKRILWPGKRARSLNPPEGESGHFHGLAEGEKPQRKNCLNPPKGNPGTSTLCHFEPLAPQGFPTPVSQTYFENRPKGQNFGAPFFFARKSNKKPRCFNAFSIYAAHTLFRKPTPFFQGKIGLQEPSKQKRSTLIV